jgi:hypothetical protein
MAGYKTYIVMIIGILVNGAIAMGYISADLLPTINSILGFLGLGAIRHGIAHK